MEVVRCAVFVPSESKEKFSSQKVEYPQDPYVIETFDCQEPVRFLWVAPSSRSLTCDECNAIDIALHIFLVPYELCNRLLGRL